MRIEATLQIRGGDLIPYEFHTLPRIGEQIRIGTKEGRLELEDKATVVNIIHLLTPKRHENGNFHLINILAD